jgi:hypothetical protein
MSGKYGSGLIRGGKYGDGKYGDVIPIFPRKILLETMKGK